MENAGILGRSANALLHALNFSMTRMNRFLRALLFATLPLHALAPLTSLAGNAGVSVQKAVELAQEQLEMRALQASVQIESVVLQPATVLGASKIWTVLWSKSVPLDNGKYEVGVEVDMSGKVVRLVKKTGGSSKLVP